MKNLDAVFNPQSIAVVGASREPNKIGHVIVKNFVDGGFAGKVYPINPSGEEILGLRSYRSVLEIKGKVDSAVIAVPAAAVPGVLEECGKKGIRGVVLITSGFSEVGKVEEENRIAEIANKYGMALIGPNCMGVITPASRVDSVFLPIYKLGRPRVGRHIVHQPVRRSGRLHSGPGCPGRHRHEQVRLLRQRRGDRRVRPAGIPRTGQGHGHNSGLPGGSEGRTGGSSR